MQLLAHTALKDYAAIATALSIELAASAVERDRQAGTPDEEVQRLRRSRFVTSSGTASVWRLRGNLGRRIQDCPGAL